MNVNNPVDEALAKMVQGSPIHVLFRPFPVSSSYAGHGKNKSG